MVPRSNIVWKWFCFGFGVLIAILSPEPQSNLLTLGLVASHALSPGSHCPGWNGVEQRASPPRLSEGPHTWSPTLSLGNPHGGGVPLPQEDWGHRVLLFIRLENGRKPCTPMFCLPTFSPSSALVEICPCDVEAKKDRCHLADQSRFCYEVLLNGSPSAGGS